MKRSSDLISSRNEDFEVKNQEDEQYLECAICLNISFFHQPVYTPCLHVFCKECIERHLTMATTSSSSSSSSSSSLMRNRSFCPKDRKPLRKDELKPLDELTKRLFETKTLIKCCVKTKVHSVNSTSSSTSEEDNVICCSWEGTLGKYSQHLKEYHFEKATINELQNRLKQLQESVCTKNQEILNMESRLFNGTQDRNNLMSRLAQRDHSLLQASTEILHLRREIQNQKDEITKMKEEVLSFSISFDSKYSYNRFRIVELTQLICKHLRNKPSSISSKRIFSNVQAMHIDFVKKYEDNPKNYEEDMRMLVSTCVASNWFTEKQQGQMSFWLKDM